MIREEGDQFGQDIRLLFALSAAVMQLEQGLMAIALEHHPESIQYRKKQLQLHIESCKETLCDMINLSEVQDQIRACLDDMSWWQKNLFDRNGASTLKHVADLQLPDIPQPSDPLNTGSSGSMLVWIEPNKGIQVRTLTAADDDTSIDDVEASLAELPAPRYVALAPSTSLVIGETYRLNLLDPNSTEGWAERNIPIRILKKTRKKGDRKWIGVRMDVAETVHVEIMVSKG